MKYAVIGGGIAAAAGVGGFVLLSGRGPSRPPWLIDEAPFNKVDYSQVPQRIESPILKVAQWYDYWPGSFIVRFQNYIFDKYGVNVDVIQDIYTSNEELFTWITQTGKKFDVIFPTNYTVGQMERAGLLFNMNIDWLSNYANLFDWTKYTVPANGYARRAADGSLIAVPYQWGTTGIGFRTDRGWSRLDVESVGYDVFWMDSWFGVDVRQKLMMLDDMRETFGQTYKYLGWKEQVDLGYAPTAIPRNPVAPYNGEYQWSENETADAKINGARDALLAAKQRLLTFNTQNQGPFLVQNVVYIDTAWSGDIMYAIRPHTSTPQPVDYWVPQHGGARWIDNAAIHRESRNLWLAHEFINFFLDPVEGAGITDWNLYATPNAQSYDRLTIWQNGYDPRQDARIYADNAEGYGGPSILERCEYQQDLGPETTLKYLDAWSQVKFG